MRICFFRSIYPVFSAFQRRICSAKQASSGNSRCLFGFKIVGLLSSGALLYYEKQKKEKNSNFNYQLYLREKKIEIIFAELSREDREPKSLKLAELVNRVVLPFYKEPMPQYAGYRQEGCQETTPLFYAFDWEYQRAIKKIQSKECVARQWHGTMHAARTVIWSQILFSLYEKLGRKNHENRLCLFLAAGLHDVAREGEGCDYWEKESAWIAREVLRRLAFSQEQMATCSHAIEEKDPKAGVFSSDVQRILHDADCLEIMRLTQLGGFRKSNLQFYHFQIEQRPFYDALIAEIADFILLTEKVEYKVRLEHTSNAFYQELVELLLSAEKNGKKRFPLLIGLWNG